ncbi:MAG TPA: hypothetical protein DD422_01970 [Akkermansia sp.]|nr:hypothetical protein [Akkermansia sp.]
MRKNNIFSVLFSAVMVTVANAELVASFDSLTGISQTSGDWAFLNNSAVNPLFENGTAIFQNGADVLYLKKSDNSSFAANNQTLTMTISGLQPGGNAGNTLNALFTSSNTWGLCLSSSGQSKITGMWNNVQWNNANNRAISIPEGTFTLTVTMGTKNGQNGTLLYINGQEEAFISGLYGSSLNTNQYCIGNNSSGNKGTSFTLHNLYLHDTRLTAEEVADFYAEIVPEPATATLGLLGLGILCFNRRRRA